MMESMSYTQSLLAGCKAVGYHAKAAPPTVTKPRLKAMVSRAIGGFLDVAFNFNMQAFLDDDLLGHFKLLHYSFGDIDVHHYIWITFVVIPSDGGLYISERYLYVCAAAVCTYAGVFIIAMTAVYTCTVFSFRVRNDRDKSI